MTLVKATLQQLGPEPDKPKPIGKPIKVQFNPTTLRYQLSNNVDMGKSFGRSAALYQGTSQGTVQFELIFDTADEDADGKPVDVRTKTKELEKFLLPDKKQPKSVPPRVEFSYGSFSVVGVMSALNQDFELFAESGVPLRAKLSVTIKEQKPEFEAAKVGAGSNTGTAAKPFDHGKPTPAGAPPDRTGTALAGESAADFASRMGLDPAAWKSFAAGLGDTLSLEAGVRIDFSASASVGLGLGVQAGATAGVGGGGRRRGGAGDADRDVTAAEATGAGGVTKAIEGRASVRAAEAAADQRASFGLASPSATTRMPATTTTTTTASPAAAMDVAGRTTEGVDPRAVSYGAGIPLRDRVGSPDQAPVALVAHIRCGKREQP